MSLKFVDSMSTAQHKQLLVSSAISLYLVINQENMSENDEDTTSDMSFMTVLL